VGESPTGVSATRGLRRLVVGLLFRWTSLMLIEIIIATSASSPWVILLHPHCSLRASGRRFCNDLFFASSLGPVTLSSDYLQSVRSKHK
jgi:hypothetical protein